MNKEDQTHFQTLWEVFYDLNRRKLTACARKLGISTQTFDAWYKRPPKSHWWMFILRLCIQRELQGQLPQRSYTKRAELHRWAREQLKGMPTPTQLAQFGDEDPVKEWGGAAKFLAHTLRDGPVYYDDLRKPANCGGYSPQALRIAARVIGVTMEQVGYGADKRSLWSWEL